MMNIIFAVMILISVICAAATGKMPELSQAAINSCVEAVELFIYLIGGMCMWGGLMRIAETSHLTDKIAALFRPVLGLIFRGIDTNGKAFHAICLNITANMLGLGNAATPLGIEAMRALEAEEHTNGVASRNMVAFIVLNTASITLIPTTAASLRSKHGSASPMDIMPCVIITSAVALAAGLTAALAYDGISAAKRKVKKKCPTG